MRFTGFLYFLYSRDANNENNNNVVLMAKFSNKKVSPKQHGDRFTKSLKISRILSIVLVNAQDGHIINERISKLLSFRNVRPQTKYISVTDNYYVLYIFCMIEYSCRNNYQYLRLTYFYYSFFLHVIASTILIRYSYIKLYFSILIQNVLQSYK